MTASGPSDAAPSAVDGVDANDFVFGSATSGTLTFLAGETSQTITLEVQGDTDIEPDEGFTVFLFDPENATIGPQREATGTIQNDEATDVILGTENADTINGSAKRL